MGFVLDFTFLVDVDYNTVFLWLVGWLSLGYLIIMNYYDWFKNCEYVFSFD